MSSDDQDQSVHSSLREGIIEHILIGEITRNLWCRGHRDIEVLRAVTDAAGYDVVIAANGVTRHIQFKASTSGAKTARQTISTALAKHPSGCVIWVFVDPQLLTIDRLLFFGGIAGAPLPNLGDNIAKHTKGDASGRKQDRPNQRVVNKGRFDAIDSTDDLITLLFYPNHQNK